jgi:hypothetical protein
MRIFTKLLTSEVISIGIGRGLTASPLPHHRTCGARRRRFGRCSQRARRSLSGASSPVAPVARSSPASTPSAAAPHASSPRHRRRRLRAPVQAVRPFPRPYDARCGLRRCGQGGWLRPPACPGPPAERPGEGWAPSAHSCPLSKPRPGVRSGLRGAVPPRPERVPPRLGFLFVAPRLRATRPSAPASRRRPCAALLLRPHLPGARTCTSEHQDMPGTHGPS